MKALPLSGRCRPSPRCPSPRSAGVPPGGLTGLSLTLLKATALEVAILAGRLLLYPSGITQERRRPATPASRSAVGVAASRQRPARRSCCCTAS
ncbi:hypothetical protein SGLAM104S_06538 [Streptomyces glaucescens]